ncbi:MAG: hypothetical protein ABIM19_07880 [candidate division WOR-3 bacterium]
MNGNVRIVRGFRIAPAPQKGAEKDSVAQAVLKAAEDRAKLNEKRVVEDATLFSSFVPALDIAVGGSTTRATLFMGQTLGGGNEWRTNVRNTTGGPDDPMVITGIRFLLDAFNVVTGTTGLNAMIRDILRGGFDLKIRGNSILKGAISAYFDGDLRVATISAGGSTDVAMVAPPKGVWFPIQSKKLIKPQDSLECELSFPTAIAQTNVLRLICELKGYKVAERV